MIKPLTTNTYAIYQKSKEMGVWPITIASRDFVMINHVEQRADGGISMLVFTEPDY